MCSSDLHPADEDDDGHLVEVPKKKLLFSPEAAALKTPPMSIGGSGAGSMSSMAEVRSSRTPSFSSMRSLVTPSRKAPMTSESATRVIFGAFGRSAGGTAAESRRGAAAPHEGRGG